MSPSVRSGTMLVTATSTATRTTPAAGSMVKVLVVATSSSGSASTVALRTLALGGLDEAAAAAVGLQGVPVAAQGAALRAGFDTPNGPVHLSSDD